MSEALEDWLHTNGFDRHKFAFRGLSLEHLPLLSSFDLKEMGLSTVAERMRFLAIARKQRVFASRPDFKRRKTEEAIAELPQKIRKTSSTEEKKIPLSLSLDSRRSSAAFNFSKLGNVDKAKAPIARGLSDDAFEDSIPEFLPERTPVSRRPSLPLNELGLPPLSRSNSIASIVSPNFTPALGISSPTLELQENDPEPESEATSAAPKLGDYVRVKRAITEPTHGWGSASHASVGRVTGLDGQKCWIVWEFPQKEIRPWAGKLNEMEVCELPAHGNAFASLAKRLMGKRPRPDDFDVDEEEMEEKVLLSADALAKAVQWLGGGSVPLADVTLVAIPKEEGKCQRAIRIAAHRAMLSAWSLPFRKMFLSERFKRVKFGGEVPIPVDDVRTFREFIRFMYVPLARLEKRNVFQMLALADYWQVEHLVSQCVAFIEKTIALKELPQVWRVADRISYSPLIQFCAGFAAQNIRECHELLDTPHLRTALLRDDLAVANEQEVFDIVRTRIRALHCGKTNESDADALIVDLLGAVRFSNLPQGALDVKELRTVDGKPRSTYMEVLLKQMGGPKAKTRMGLRFTSVEELKPGMFVRILNDVPRVTELCYEKPPGATAGPVKFTERMALFCGKLAYIEEIEERHGAAKTQGKLFPFTCFERVSALEQERIKFKLKSRELKEGDYIDVLDNEDEWLSAFVKTVHHDGKDGSSNPEVLVGFTNIDSKWDVLMPMSSPKIATHHMYSRPRYDGKPLRHYGRIHVKLQQLSDSICKMKNGTAQRDRSRDHSDDDGIWPPPGIDLTPLGDENGDLEECMHSKILMGEEVTWRRIAQLAHSKVCMRIRHPRFTNTDEVESLEEKMLLERKEALSDNSFLTHIQIEPKIIQLWEGERREEKLIEGLQPKDVVFMKSILKSTIAHEKKQATIDRSPRIVAIDSKDSKVNGTYALVGYAHMRPKYVNEFGTELAFDLGKWRFIPKDAKSAKFSESAEGFFPPLQEWSQNGAPRLGIDETSLRHDESLIGHGEASGLAEVKSKRSGEGSRDMVMEEEKVDEKQRSGRISKDSTIIQLKTLYSFVDGPNKIEYVYRKLMEYEFDPEDILRYVNLLGFDLRATTAAIIKDISNDDEDEREGPRTDDQMRELRALRALAALL